MITRFNQAFENPVSSINELWGMWLAVGRQVPTSFPTAQVAVAQPLLFGSEA